MKGVDLAALVGEDFSQRVGDVATTPHQHQTNRMRKRQMSDGNDENEQALIGIRFFDVRIVSGEPS